jgi:hypothetical protein
MLEAMLGADKRNQLMGWGVFLAGVVLAFVGMCLIVVASINPIVHSVFWPGIAILLIATAALMAHRKAVRLTLSIVVFLLGLWVVLNVMLGINVPEVPELDMGGLLTGGVEMTEMMTDTMLQLMTAGGAIGALGGLAGMFGALKYSGTGTQIADSGVGTEIADSGAGTQETE